MSGTEDRHECPVFFFLTIVASPQSRSLDSFINILYVWTVSLCKKKKHSI